MATAWSGCRRWCVDWRRYANRYMRGWRLPRRPSRMLKRRSASVGKRLPANAPEGVASKDWRVRYLMNKKQIRFSPVEVVLVVFLLLSLVLGILQARREEIARRQRQSEGAR